MTKIVFIIFFILGMIFYFVFPKDAHIEVPDSPPRVYAGTEQLMNDEGNGHCQIYENYLAVDGTHISGPQKVVCK